MNVVEVVECNHGGDPATCPQCIQIRQILADDPDRGAFVVPYDSNAEGYSSAKEWFRQNHLAEQERPAEQQISPVMTGARRPLTDIFPSVHEVRLATRLHALSREEGAVIAAYLELKMAGGGAGGVGRPNWTAIAKKAGCERRTAKRSFTKATRRICQPGLQALEIRPIARYRVEGPGAGLAPAWVQYEARLGDEWKFCWMEPDEPVHEPAEVQEVRRRTPLRVSWMRCLLRALVEELSGTGLHAEAPQTRVPAEELTDAHPHTEAPDVRATSDWYPSLKWARRRITSAHRKVKPSAAADITRLLCRGLPTCSYCHTPILVGCTVRGARVTRRRRFCDEGCKMGFKRRTERTIAGGH